MKSIGIILAFCIPLLMPAQVPVINSVSPLAAEIGSTLTINGSNFSTIPNNNIVYFGAVKTTAFSATSTSLQVRVPKDASFEHIRVTVLPTGLSAFSPKQFQIVFPGGDSSFTLNTFTNAFSSLVNLSSSVDDFMIADIDADGKADIVVLTNPGGTAHDVYYFRNTTVNGQLSFAAPIIRTYPGWTSRGLWFGDVDGDGLGDLLIGCFQQLSIHRNVSTPGNISLAAPVNIINILPGEVFTIQAHDMDGDGKSDILATNNGAVTAFKNLSTPGNILLANQTIVFPAPSLTTRDEEVRIADLDGDTKPDLVVTHFYVDSLYAFRNLSSPGNILFEAPFRLHTGGQIQGPGGLSIGDVDNDNRADLTFATVDRVNIYKNGSSPGSLNIYPMFGLANYWFTNQSNLADLNGDMKLDLITNHSFAGASIHKSNSSPCNAAFEPRVDFYTSNGAWDIAINDLTGDGKPEIVVRSGGMIRVLKNLIGQSVRICSGANTTIASSLSGTTYQWQQNTGAGFTNISNGPNLSGTNSATLQFLNTPLSWNGYKYRCVVDTDTSNVYSLSVQATITPSVVVTRCPQFLCAGNIATLTATAINGGASPAYQWQDSINISGWANIPGATSATLSNYTVISGAKVRCVLTSTVSCASPITVNSNALVMQYFSGVTPTANISGNTTVVTGQSAAISSAITNGGAAPGYQWQDSTSTHGWQNLNAAQATINYSPGQTGDKLRLILNSNAFCATPSSITSNTLVFTVNTVTSVDPTAARTFGIRYFPNPARSMLYIDSLKLLDRWQTLEIISMSGEKVLPVLNIVNKSFATIDLSPVPAGAYMMILRRKTGGPVYLKLIKQ